MDGMPNFGDLPVEFSNLETAKVVIVPVPYEKTSTWLKGSADGPAAIIEASANMELYDIETDSEVYRHGIFTDEPVRTDGTPEEMVEIVHARVHRFVEQGKFVVALGGEHTVSLAPIKAHCRRGNGLSVLQLDAHCDLRQQYNGCRYNHACVMARARELAPVVQVGIRSMDSSEKPFVDRQNVFFAEEIYDNHAWIRQVLERLTEKVYITIDLDVFDPSIMPSTGTPEPGGLSWYDVLALLRTVSRHKDVVGFDVVELCPQPNNKSPDFLAAKLIYKLLGYKFRG